jgi:hypothetical protein
MWATELFFFHLSPSVFVHLLSLVLDGNPMRRRTGAHVLGDKSAVAINQLGAATVVDANDATQVLWVEPSRERSRADEITKHLSCWVGEAAAATRGAKGGD